MSAKSFWDIHPEVRDLAGSLTEAGSTYETIQMRIGKQFGIDLMPSRTQIYHLRKGLQSGRWTVPAEQKQPKTAPEQAQQPKESPKTPPNEPVLDAPTPEMPIKALTLRRMECVACRIKGMIALSGKACLDRQLRTVSRKNGRKWTIFTGVTAMHPGYAACVGCPFWLTDGELQATAAALKRKTASRVLHDGDRIL